MTLFPAPSVTIKWFDMSRQVAEMWWKIENGAYAKLIPVSELIFQLHFICDRKYRYYVLPRKIIACVTVSARDII